MKTSLLKNSFAGKRKRDRGTGKRKRDRKRKRDTILLSQASFLLAHIAIADLSRFRFPDLSRFRFLMMN